MPLMLSRQRKRKCSNIGLRNATSNSTTKLTLVSIISGSTGRKSSSITLLSAFSHLTVLSLNHSARFIQSSRVVQIRCQRDSVLDLGGGVGFGLDVASGDWTGVSFVSSSVASSISPVSASSVFGVFSCQ